jgi:hypothetical protein
MMYKNKLTVREYLDIALCWFGLGFTIALLLASK